MSTAPLEGIDVSHIQGAIDWNEVAAAGKTFAFVKATQGVDWVDPMFATNWPAIQAARLQRGAYHFFQPGDDPTAQAQNFLAVVRPVIAAGDLPAVLDIETAKESSGTTEAAAQVLADIEVWLALVAQALGKPPILYTSPGFWNGLGSAAFGQYPLWVAEYGVSTPKSVDGWTAWTFWQYSETGTVAGVSGTVDLDYFQGDATALAALATPTT